MANSTQVAGSRAITPDLSIVDGQITTTSQQIAEHFGKRHADVIRAIRKLDAPSEFTERNFALSEFKDSTGRALPAYRITRDGFTLLAMGFTGKEAMQWKVAYLTAFNKMEAELLERTMRPANPAIDPTDAPAMAAARKVALDYFDAYRATVKDGKTWAEMDDIPSDALQGMIASAIMSQRMLVSFDYSTGRMCSSLIPGDSSVVSFKKDDYREVASRIPMERIPEMLEALSQRVSCHLGAFRERLQRERETFMQTRPGVMKAVAA